LRLLVLLHHHLLPLLHLLHLHLLHPRLLLLWSRRMWTTAAPIASLSKNRFVSLRQQTLLLLLRLLLLLHESAAAPTCINPQALTAPPSARVLGKRPREERQVEPQAMMTTTM